MALIKCTECGAEISDKAKSCPKCGCPIELHSDVDSENIEDNPVSDVPKKKSHKWLWISLVALIIAGAASAAWFVYSSKDVASVFIGEKEEPKVKITPEFCNAIRKYNELREFREGFAAVKNGDKWGFINTEGKEVVTCKYDEVSNFINGFAMVKNGEKSGLVNPAGQEVIPCKYDEVDLGDNGLATVVKGGKSGFVNTGGKVVVPCKYDDSRCFHEGLAAVLKDGKWGFIDAEGKVVIPFKFRKDQELESAGPEFSQGVAFVHADMDNDGKYENFFVDKTGNVVLKLAEKYDVDYALARGWEPKFNEDKVCSISGDDDIVYLDMQGNEVKGYKEKLHEESLYETYKGRDDKEGIKETKTGKYIIPAKYSTISSGFSNGVALAELQYTEVSSGPSGCNEETVHIYGYVDLEGNETFTSDDYIKVRQANNEAMQEKFRLEQAAQQPDWLQGEWFYRNSHGTCYAKIEGDNILVAFGNDMTYNGPYTIEDNHLVYDRHDGMSSYFVINTDRQVLMMDENESNSFYRSADEANSASGSSGSRSNSSQRNPYTRDMESLTEHTNEYNSGAWRGDPMRMVYLQQAIMSDYDNLISTARSQGDERRYYGFMRAKQAQMDQFRSR